METVSITADYDSDGRLLQYRCDYIADQSLPLYTMTRVPGLAALDVASIGRNGIVRSLLRLSEPEPIEPAPAWLIRVAFAVFHGGEVGTLHCALFDSRPTAVDWVTTVKVRWSVSIDSVLVGAGESVDVWRLDGEAEQGSLHLNVYVGKRAQGVLRLEMRSLTGAVMLVRAGA